jgi:Protein of unknown function (DUF2752)
VSRSVALLWGGVVLVLVAVSPFGALFSDSLWSCAFKSLTGLPCPTCGTTRAALALSRLDLWGAFSHYPLPTVGWIVFLGGGLLAASMSLLGRTPPAIPNRLPAWARGGIAAALLANWIYSIATGV